MPPQAECAKHTPNVHRCLMHHCNVHGICTQHISHPRRLAPCVTHHMLCLPFRVSGVTVRVTVSCFIHLAALQVPKFCTVEIQHTAVWIWLRLTLATCVLELVYLQPLALRKNVHQSWPLATLPRTRMRPVSRGSPYALPECDRSAGQLRS